MSLQQSVIRIYDSAQAVSPCIPDIVTQSSSTDISVSGLDEGTEYWCAVQVTDSLNLTSAESARYRFYTLPDVTWFAGPYGANGSISAQLDGITQDVTIARYGIVYATQSDFSDAVYYDQVQGGIDIYGLAESTMYYVRPYVIDEFGRRWVNEDAETTVSTIGAVPVVNWAGMSAVGSTTYQTQINVTSSSPVTQVMIRVYQGGTMSSVFLTAQTGTQSVNLTGLMPNTQYTIVALATNAAGTGYSSNLSFTTIPAIGDIEVNITNAVVDNATNIISVDSRATYDSSIITITGHYIELYSNDTHTGTADESISGGAVDNYSANLGHANPDETYYVFSRVTYTVTGDNTVYTAWSSPKEITTYSLLSLGAISTTATTASVPYSVAGNASSVELAYSADGTTWTAIPAPSYSGGTVNITGLSPNTTYYIKGRAQSTIGWSDYDSTTFTTQAISTTITITSVTNIGSNSANVNLNITE